MMSSGDSMVYHHQDSELFPDNMNDAHLMNAMSKQPTIINMNDGHLMSAMNKQPTIVVMNDSHMINAMNK